MADSTERKNPELSRVGMLVDVTGAAALFFFGEGYLKLIGIALLLDIMGGGHYAAAAVNSLIDQTDN